MAGFTKLLFSLSLTLSLCQQAQGTTFTPTPSSRRPITTTPQPAVGDGDVRLASINDCPHEGRLEVKYNNMWGTVCNDEFTTTAAQIACRQMNYTSGMFLAGVTFPGEGRIWLDNVQCTSGRSRLIDCNHNTVGHHDCTHSEDVVIACFFGNSREYCPGSELHERKEGGLRLRGGSCSDEGRLEIYHSNQWGTICDDGFGEPEAYLACQQLGFDSGVTIRAPGPGAGPIWLDDLACTYQHSSLAECGGSRWGREDCSHSEDVGVHCYNESATVDCHGNPVPPEGGLRIVDGECPFSGRLEIWHAHRWGTVCDLGFNDTDAAVACQQLGYSAGWVHNAPSGGSGVHIWVKNINCRGDETNISMCTHDTWGSTYGCSHDRDTGILCSNSNARRDCAGDLINHVDGEVRLVAGNCTSYGLLEIYHQGRWGTVCDDSFTDIAATVACKQLGYREGYMRSPPRPGTGITWLDNVRCQKYHNRLAECLHAPWGVEDCGHSEDIGIQCYNGTGSLDCDGNRYPEDGALRLANSNCSLTGRLQIFHAGRWGSVCEVGFDQTEVTIACKQLGFNYGFFGTVEATSQARTFPHKVWLKGLACNTSHTELSQCPRTGDWGATGCDYNQDVFITCSETPVAYDCQGNQVRFVEGELRMVGGANNSVGRLEVFHSGRWGSVCDDSFGSTDATVACRELGFHRGVLGSRTLAPDGPGLTWLDEVACLPTDTKLALCRHSPWGREDCGSSEDVRLKCSNETECDSNPCLNGATCKNGFNVYACQCQPGFQGSNCQFNIDECGGNPCMNGGTCEDGINDFTCNCVAGYTSKNCSVDINDCDPNPCQNGATCNDRLNGYNCACAPGFRGGLCRTNIDECESMPCRNGGSCTDGINSVRCDCKQGFTGKLCHININECSSKPCKNNGTCLDGNNWFFCVCPAGYMGKYCEVALKINGQSGIVQPSDKPSVQVVSDGGAKGIAAVAICIAIIVLIILIVLIVRWKILGSRHVPSDDGREEEVAVWNGSSDKVNLVP